MFYNIYPDEDFGGGESLAFGSDLCQKQNQGGDKEGLGK